MCVLETILNAAQVQASGSCRGIEKVTPRVSAFISLAFPSPFPPAGLFWACRASGSKQPGLSVRPQVIGDGSEEQRPLGPPQPPALVLLDGECRESPMHESLFVLVQCVGKAEMERAIGASRICFPLQREERNDRFWGAVIMSPLRA